jgi:Leucine-rich repeat (LRR) protein
MSLHLVKKGTLDEYSSGDNTDPIQFEPVSLNQIEVPPVVESNTQVLELLAVEESHIDITLEFLNEEAEIDYKLSLDNLNWHDEIVYGEGGDVAGEISNLDATSGDIRKDIYIKAEVNNDGSVSAGVRTNTKISLLWKSIPIIDGIPTISGLEIEGEILTALPASVSGNPTPTSTWQWKRSGVPISGATNNTYLLVEDDIGETITVVQTETNSAGADSAESAETGEILYYVLIPDSNFEQALIDLGIDSNPVIDGRVLKSDVENVTFLDVSSKNISDLTGIEAFTALEIFYCYFNQLTSLDMSANTALTQLGCFSNQLTSLDVSANTALTDFYCYENQLTSLDVSNNTALMFLLCHSNQLTSLDVSANTALTDFYCYENQLTSLNVANGNNTNFAQLKAQGNPNLTCIQVDDVAYSAANWIGADFTFDPQHTFSEDCNYVNIPDANFEQALIDLGIDTNPVLDGRVLRSDVEGVTSLDVSSKNIADLKGIEAFTSLEILYCYENQLTSLDVSSNTALTQLGCSSNELTSLDLSANTLLESLYCHSTQLANLDLSANTALTYLSCWNNQLTSLDISSSTALTYLNCSSNQLTSLDVSANTLLKRLYCDANQLTSLNVANGNNIIFITLKANNNPNLTCIQVDDAAYSEANWTGFNFSFDPQTSFSEDCYVNIPDSNFEQILINLGIDSNPVIDGKVLRSEVEGVTSLNVSSRNISDLTGIEAFTALEELYCQFNQLTSLDLSSHSNLVLIDCADNQLNSLNVANGNNENIIIFLARNNPDLTCVQVDDQAYSEANWNFGAKQFDPQTSFSEDCN